MNGVVDEPRLTVLPMKIDVSRIPEAGLTLDAAYDPAALEMNQDGVQVDGLHLRGRATKEARELFVSAEITCRLTMTCARCLEPVRSDGATDVLLHYDTSRQVVVDITDDVRQEVMLDYPLTAVCRPDCRGLCARCGANLNQGCCPHAG